VTRLHARLAALLALLALLTFITGAGLDAPSVIPAGALLLIAIFVQPGERAARLLEPLWRVVALLLALRAGLAVFLDRGDPVLPMVDLLLLLLCAESLRRRDGSGDARHFALTFALLIAAAAYRPGPLFGVLFMAYVIVATLTLVVGQLSRQSLNRGLPPPPPRAAFLARVAALGIVVIATSTFVFLFFPRVTQAWAIRSSPLPASAVMGFSDRVSIGEHGASIEPNPQVVLRVEFPDGVPASTGSLYWRGRSYNRFDGRTWSRVDRTATPSTDAQRWPGSIVEQTIYARQLAAANVVFGLHPIVSVASQSRTRTFRGASDDFLYVGETDPVYRIRSRPERPDPDSLRQVEMRYTPEVMAHLQLPPMSARLRALADSFRVASSNIFDQSSAIEQWLHTFGYTLDLPDSPAEATLDHFIFQRRAGHCEYFSTAMAVLLRAGGVPARNVNGFLGGEWNEFGGFLTVTQNHAHSWVEVWFPGWGWVPFDPTPPGAVSGGVSARGLLSLRLLFTGLEHRWGKWVLDYDLGTQTELFRRTVGSLTPRARRPAASEGDASLVRLLVVVALLMVVAGALLRSARAFGRGGRSAPTREYLRLRRAYQRSGLPPARALPPLQFVAAIEDAPGAPYARRAVELYVRARFGASPLTRIEVQVLHESVAAALRELRRGRRQG
jgi:protein-glutamine gamma-glutamyltransferase